MLPRRRSAPPGTFPGRHVSRRTARVTGTAAERRPAVEWVDRGTVLHATDLRELATEVCGPPRGRGASAKWHCPDPAHPDEHPGGLLGRASTQRQRTRPVGKRTAPRRRPKPRPRSSEPGCSTATARDTRQDRSLEESVKILRCGHGILPSGRAVRPSGPWGSLEARGEPGGIMDR
jgi:hypothetical protein